MRSLLVGESNPFEADPRAALWPYPEHHSDGRLAKILGLTWREYLLTFDRVNLLALPKGTSWSVPDARARAVETVPRAVKLTARFVSDAMPGYFPPLLWKGIPGHPARSGGA